MKFFALFFFVSFFSYCPLANAATWIEPTCDPATNPSACAVSPPLNISSDSQTKTGSLTIKNNLLIQDIASTTNRAALNANGTFYSYSTAGKEMLKFDPNAGAASMFLGYYSSSVDYATGKLNIYGSGPQVMPTMILDGSFNPSGTSYAEIKLGYPRVNAPAVLNGLTGRMDVYAPNSTNVGTMILGNQIYQYPTNYSPVTNGAINTQTLSNVNSTYKDLTIKAGASGSYAGNIAITSAGTTTAAGNITMTAGAATIPGSIALTTNNIGNIQLTPNDSGQVQIAGNGEVVITKDAASAGANPALTITQNKNVSKGLYIDNNGTASAIDVSTGTNINPGVNIIQTGSANGLYSQNTADGIAVYGISSSNIGVKGESNNGTGVEAKSNAGVGLNAYTTSGTAAINADNVAGGALFSYNQTAISTANYSADFQGVVNANQEIYARAFYPTGDQYSLYNSKRQIKERYPLYWNGFSGAAWTQTNILLDGITWDGNYMWGVYDNTNIIQMDSQGSIINKRAFQSSYTLTFKDMVAMSDSIAILAEYTSGVTHYCGVFLMDKTTLFAPLISSVQGSDCNAITTNGSEAYFIQKSNSAAKASWYIVDATGYTTPGSSFNLSANGCDSPKDIAYGGNSIDIYSKSGIASDIVYISCTDQGTTNTPKIFIGYVGPSGATFYFLVATVDAPTRPDKLFFDGKYLWITSNSTTSTIAGLYKYYVDNSSVIGVDSKQSAYNYRYIPAVGTNVSDMSFDGTNLWVLNSSLTQLSAIPVANGNEDYEVFTEADLTDLAFDGNRIWLSGIKGTQGKIKMYSTANASFDIDNPSQYRGVILTGSRGTPYCVYMSQVVMGSPALAFVSYDSADPTGVDSTLFKNMCMGGNDY